MDRDQAMLKVIEDVYEGGKDLIPNWRLMDHAKATLTRRGIEGLRSYYERCLDLSDPRGRWVKKILEDNGRKTLESEHQRFMGIYRSKSN